MIIEATVSLHNSVKATFNDFRLTVTRIILCGSEDDGAVPTMDSEGCFDNGRGVQETYIMVSLWNATNMLRNIVHSVAGNVVINYRLLLIIGCSSP